MAVDHFKRHPHPDGSVDWNFNILLGGQPQVDEMAREYGKAFDHPGLYPPIPVQWLHMTILRVGYTTEYTDAEMMAVAGQLKPNLAAMRVPELILGPWMIWSGNPVLIVTPWDSVEPIFNAVMSAMTNVVGKKRQPHPERFIPHVALAYNRDYDQEKEVHQKLWEYPVDPVSFRARNLSMIKQKQEPSYYSWEIVKDIPIGQVE